MIPPKFVTTMRRGDGMYSVSTQLDEMLVLASCYPAELLGRELETHLRQIQREYMGRPRG